jgi:alpha-L-rhamnosidase
MNTIWAKNIRADKNHTLGFLYTYKPENKQSIKMTAKPVSIMQSTIADISSDDPKALSIQNSELSIEIVASNIYRLFINGKFAGYGPARAAHGHVRKDIYDLKEYKTGKINIVIEVFAANVNSYYLVDELPFFGANLTANGKTIAASADFEAFLLDDRVQKVQRYSFQRPFAESYVMKKCRSNFYNGDRGMFPKVETESVTFSKIIDRNIDYPLLKSIPFKAEIEYGTVSINKDNPKWMDRCLVGIDDELKGYKYEDLQDRLSDDASEFDYRPFGTNSNDTAIRQNEYKLFSFGRTLTGFLGLKLNALKKTTLYVIWDEIIWDEDQKDDKSDNAINEGDQNSETTQSSQSGQSDEISQSSSLNDTSRSNVGESASGNIDNKHKKAKNICFYRNTCCNVLKYKLEPGEYNLLQFEATSAQYAKIIIIEGEISINDFSMVLYENKNAYDLKFECEDKSLQLIVESAANTFSQNAVDVLTDCPSRERAGWLCDAYFSGKAEKLFTGKNEIETNFLENFIMTEMDQLPQLPVGMLPMCYPAEHINGVYIPNWAMWFVLELADFNTRNPGNNLILKSREKIYALIDFFKKYINEDGLLENLESWVFIEWSKCNDEEFIKGVNYPSNMAYSAMLSAVGKMYGDDNLLSQSEQMNKTIIKQSYNGKLFEDNRIRENGLLVSKSHTTETCQYYAFYFGVARRDDFPELFDMMVSEFGPSRDAEKTYPLVYISNAIVGNYLRLEILLRNNFHKLAIEECKAFFDFMARRTSTLWEHSFASGSLNHGFASVAANYIVECITGFVYADTVSKKAYFKNPEIMFKSRVSIPVSGDNIIIKTTDKTREIETTSGYEIVYLN